MNNIDIFLGCKEGHKAYVRELKKAGEKYPVSITRILEVFVKRNIHREMVLSNGKTLKFDPIPIGSYRVREIYDSNGKYGWQFISTKTGMPICGHNREKLLKNHLIDIEVKSEKRF